MIKLWLQKKLLKMDRKYKKIKIIFKKQMLEKSYQILQLKEL